MEKDYNKISFFIIFILQILFISKINAEDLKNQKARCHIKIHWVFRSGDEEKEVFDLPLKNKEKCTKAANKHRTNFNPGAIKEVFVKEVWDE